jgi:RNase P/RNase MRP subunit p30
MLIEGNDFQKIREKIKKNKDKKIIFSGINDDINRKVIEKEKIDVLLLNQKNRKDKTKQRDSGLNSVIAKILKKKDIAIGINFDEILDSNSKKLKAEIISRIIQNIKICKKNKVNMSFITKKNKKIKLQNIKSLGLILGMPTWMTKKLEIYSF